MFSRRISAYFQAPIVKQWLRRGLIIFIASAFLIPRDIGHITPNDLDQSWKYAINIAESAGWKFGDDIIFTYGPLGFLAATVGVGANIQITLAFSCLLFLLQLYLLFRLASGILPFRISTSRLLLFGVLVWLFPRFHLESTIQFFALTALVVAWFEKQKILSALIATLLSCLLLFVKFNAAAACCFAIAVFWVALFWKQRAAWRRIWWFPACIPILFLAGFLAYNPSWTSLINYVRASMEISSGYITAMSTPADMTWVPATLIATIGCILILALSIHSGTMPPALAMVFMGPLIIAVKHGIVRADIFHFAFALEVLIPLAGLSALFINFQSFCRKKILIRTSILLAGIALFIHVTPPLRLFGYYQRETLLQYVRFEATKEQRIFSLPSIRKKILYPLSGYSEMPDILYRAGTNSVAIYPTQISKGAFWGLSPTIFPSVQAYTMYTPYLDNLNAMYVENPVGAPAYILLNVHAIDGRWPLIETPLVWNALQTHYVVDAADDEYLLLKRRSNPATIELREIANGYVHSNEFIEVPQTDHFVYLQANCQLNIKGKLAKIFFQVPPLEMAVKFANGIELSKRCVPANLASPTLISSIPTSIEEVADVMTRQEGHSRITHISFSGPGRSYYKKSIPVEWLSAVHVAELQDKNGD